MGGDEDILPPIARARELAREEEGGSRLRAD